jgi:hypothetical protein
MIYIETLKKRERETREAIKTNAMEKARKVALMLKKKYGVKRVILFGSLARDKYLHKRTDIDLLVEGLKTEDLLRAGIDAWEITHPFDVDIIPMEKAEKGMIDIALKEGINL